MYSTVRTYNASVSGFGGWPNIPSRSLLVPSESGTAMSGSCHAVGKTYHKLKGLNLMSKSIVVIEQKFIFWQLNSEGRPIRRDLGM